MKVAHIKENLNLVANATRTGNKRTISTSKIRKIIAKRKNRRENGSRADFIGSNPHSNGEFFSRSPEVRLAKIHPRSITTLDRTIAATNLKITADISAKEIFLLCYSTSMNPVHSGVALILYNLLMRVFIRI